MFQKMKASQYGFCGSCHHSCRDGFFELMRQPNDSLAKSDQTLGEMIFGHFHKLFTFYDIDLILISYNTILCRSKKGEIQCQKHLNLKSVTPLLLLYNYNFEKKHLINNMKKYAKFKQRVQLSLRCAVSDKDKEHSQTLLFAI